MKWVHPFLPFPFLFVFSGFVGFCTRKVANLAEYEQNNYYCHAPFPGALDSLSYKAPHGSELRAIQIITRNGDRAPCG